MSLSKSTSIYGVFWQSQIFLMVYSKSHVRRVCLSKFCLSNSIGPSLAETQNSKGPCDKRAAAVCHANAIAASSSSFRGSRCFLPSLASLTPSGLRTRNAADAKSNQTSCCCLLHPLSSAKPPLLPPPPSLTPQSIPPDPQTAAASITRPASQTLAPPLSPSPMHPKP